GWGALIRAVQRRVVGLSIGCIQAVVSRPRTLFGYPHRVVRSSPVGGRPNSASPPVLSPYPALHRALKVLSRYGKAIRFVDRPAIVRGSHNDKEHARVPLPR